MTEADAKKFDALEAAGFGTRTDIIRTALDRMYVEELAVNWKLKYPIGKVFEAPVWHRGDDKNWENVEVVNYWYNNIERERGVMVRTHDGIEFEIDINYLNENGSGFQKTTPA